MTERINRTWNIGPYFVDEVEGHGFAEFDGPLYRSRIEGEDRRDSEMYTSLDHAIAAAIGRRWTGYRGAGGTAVGTAADWFMVMIGASAQPFLVDRTDEVRERELVRLRQEAGRRRITEQGHLGSTWAGRRHG